MHFAVAYTVYFFPCKGFLWNKNLDIHISDCETIHNYTYKCLLTDFLCVYSIGKEL